MRPYCAVSFGLSSSTRVYGLVGGVPLYLEWWDQRASVRDNLLQLVCTPGGRLLTEGELVLASDLDLSDLGRRIVYAIAAGRTKFNEIQQVVKTDPSRTLDRLSQLRIVEKVVPVTVDPRRARTSYYRVADNLLAFWLGIVDRYRAEIDRGLGKSVLSVLVSDLDDHLGERYEEAFRFQRGSAGSRTRRSSSPRKRKNDLSAPRRPCLARDGRAASAPGPGTCAGASLSPPRGPRSPDRGGNRGTPKGSRSAHSPV